MSTLKVNTLQNTDGVEVYTCKAWVNFNGTGTVAIRASGNVSRIIDNGNGDYTIEFIEPMPDTNYNIVFGNTSGKTATNVATTVIEAGTAGGTPATYTTTAVRITVPNGSGSSVDPTICSVSIFR